MNAPGRGYEIRQLSDRAALAELLRLRWSEGSIMFLGRLLTPDDVDVLGAYRGARLHGVATYRLESDWLQLITLNNMTERRGVGGALLDGMIALGRRRGLGRLRAAVSNDNVYGLAFYQKRGMRIVAVHLGTIDAARMVKPGIALCGLNGIPRHDEIELEMLL